jgi:predicted transcriptional regulator
MEIYNDILNAINLELTNDEAKPTRVQYLSNLAYDKLVRYLNELERKKMILQNPLPITEKGRNFLQDHDRIKAFMLEMALKYLDISERAIYERVAVWDLFKSLYSKVQTFDPFIFGNSLSFDKKSIGTCTNILIFAQYLPVVYAFFSSRLR